MVKPILPPQPMNIHWYSYILDNASLSSLVDNILLWGVTICSFLCCSMVKCEAIFVFLWLSFTQFTVNNATIFSINNQQIHLTSSQWSKVVFSRSLGCHLFLIIENECYHLIILFHLNAFRVLPQIRLLTSRTPMPRCTKYLAKPLKNLHVRLQSSNHF